jgi:3-hydroxyisobutyrate dehydrogenase-like beta-hydroxyacid dehydrogenase
VNTVSPATAGRLAQQHEQHGSHYLAAPVFGRPEAAAAKKLWICLSGNGAAKERVLPLLNGIGQKVFDFGEQIGAANVVKLTGNFLIVSALEAMAEAFTLAEKNGIERTQVLSYLVKPSLPVLFIKIMDVRSLKSNMSQQVSNCLWG